MYGLTDASLYIVKVYEDNESYEYEYGNLTHAQQHYDMEHGKVDLIAYYWNNSSGERLYKTIATKQ